MAPWPHGPHGPMIFINQIFDQFYKKNDWHEMGPESTFLIFDTAEMDSEAPGTR